jgi:hypothetical protein
VFHTGVYFDDDSAVIADELFDYRDLTERFRKEYYQGDTTAQPLDEHEVEFSETPHEAFRALQVRRCESKYTREMAALTQIIHMS